MDELIQENKELKEEVEKLKKQLENYNNSRKSYYEKNKEIIKEKAKEGLKKIAEENPEKIKEYRRKAYLKQKEKKTCIHNKNIKLCRTCDGSDLCISGFCDTMKNSKYDNYCLRCFIHLFPDKPNARNYRTKEKFVVDFVIKNFNNFSWISDKKIKDGCSRRRPDLFLDLGFNIIIIEIDENQHNNYDCSCENKRLMEISQDLGHRPIIFIRFNPDEYINKNNETVESCWKLNKNGIINITKNNIEEWNMRLENLKNQIEYWCKYENKTDKTIEIIQLYFDENNKENDGK